MKIALFLTLYENWGAGRSWPTEGGAEDYPDKLNDLISWHHADVK